MSAHPHAPAPPVGRAGSATPRRFPLAGSLRPEEAVLWLRDEERPFALVGEWLGARAVLGSEPVAVAGRGDDPFTLLDAQPDCGEGEVAVGGGWVGWLGYGLGGRIERLPPEPPAPHPRPPFSLAFHDHVIVFDGERWWFEALWSEPRRDVLEARLDTWRERMASAPPTPRVATVAPFTLAANGGAGHLVAVADCLERIAAGELFQANLCLRLESRFTGELLDLFAAALPRARPRFGALLDGTLSLSPERFLRRDGRTVHAEPIKGTAPRAGDPEAERAALLDSAKDAAEHVMIVDLMRNDLGRVSEYGTIVAEPPRIEAHAGVWHVVSTVSGQLRSGVGDGDLLRATFPPGSVTGAPKIQAMKVIAALEATRRELYTGALGIVSPVAGLDLSVAIRTFETDGETIWLGAGGGIVADSEPGGELSEAMIKASGPMRAIGAEPAAVAPRPAPAARVPPPALAHGSRPEPAAGIFETVLVENGEPSDLAEHLERLSGSLRTLYGARLSSRVAEEARAGAAGADRARLRLLADPDGAVTVMVEPAGASSAPVALVPYSLPGGLGAHKWRDRSLLDALARVVPDTLALLVDTDGDVLETGRTNVWIVENGNLITPPADGRILPGVTRGRLLATVPAAREEPINLGRLARADTIFLTSSIAGRRSAYLWHASRSRAVIDGWPK